MRRPRKIPVHMLFLRVVGLALVCAAAGFAWAQNGVGQDPSTIANVPANLPIVTRTPPSTQDGLAAWHAYAASIPPRQTVLPLSTFTASTGPSVRDVLLQSQGLLLAANNAVGNSNIASWSVQLANAQQDLAFIYQNYDAAQQNLAYAVSAIDQLLAPLYSAGTPGDLVRSGARGIDGTAYTDSMSRAQQANLAGRSIATDLINSPQNYGTINPAIMPPTYFPLPQNSCMPITDGSQPDPCTPLAVLAQQDLYSNLEPQIETWLEAQKLFEFWAGLKTVADDANQYAEDNRTAAGADMSLPLSTPAQVADIITGNVSAIQASITQTLAAAQQLGPLGTSATQALTQAQTVLGIPPDPSTGFYDQGAIVDTTQPPEQ